VSWESLVSPTKILWWWQGKHSRLIRAYKSFPVIIEEQTPWFALEILINEEKYDITEAEKEDEDMRVEVMFDRLMLMDLRKNVSRLHPRAYAELKSYKEPPKIIHNILKSTLSLFYPEKAAQNAFDDWTACKAVSI